MRGFYEGFGEQEGGGRGGGVGFGIGCDREFILWSFQAGGRGVVCRNNYQLYKYLSPSCTGNCGAHNVEE